MRVLMLAQFYPPAVGGEERAVQDLSRGLARRGHDVHVATIWHPGMNVMDDDEGVTVHRVLSSTGRLSGA